MSCQQRDLHFLRCYTVLIISQLLALSLHEMSVTVYQLALHNVPEEQRSRLCCGRNLRSCVISSVSSMGELQPTTLYSVVSR
jgi:hypothetical protein